jgi:serine/threonine protein kinase
VVASRGSSPSMAMLSEPFVERQTTLHQRSYLIRTVIRSRSISGASVSSCPSRVPPLAGDDPAHLRVFTPPQGTLFLSANLHSKPRTSRAFIGPPFSSFPPLLLLKAHLHLRRRIQDNNYEFPSDIDLSVEAVDLISSILMTQPDQRPTLVEIIAHDFFTSGPFPASISRNAFNLPADYRHMPIRAAHRNFRAVKIRAGIIEPPEGAAIVATKSTVVAMPITVPLAVVSEEEEETVPARRPVPDRIGLATRSASTQEARGMEKEVQQVLAPESPIADLLRYVFAFFHAESDC